MKKLVALFLVTAFTTASMNALEKPEGPEVDPSTASLEKDVAQIKAEGNFGPRARIARAAATKQLTNRYMELGLKSNKTEAEQKEFDAIGAELKTRIGSALSNLLPAQ